MTENPATTQSQLAEHRYVPYHFKGLAPGQKADIMATREQQLRDNHMAKENEREEERAWAMQQEANRMLMMQNEMELDEKKRTMVAQHKMQHKVDKVGKEEKWMNHYGEQVPLPEL